MLAALIETSLPYGQMLLILAVAFTWLKVRDNKIRRREELFRDSMAFFAGASE